jgi:predicted trehalose synthase
MSDLGFSVFDLLDGPDPEVEILAMLTREGPLSFAALLRGTGRAEAELQEALTILEQKRRIQYRSDQTIALAFKDS